jgi:hypothetical protein
MANSHILIKCKVEGLWCFIKVIQCKIVKPWKGSKETCPSSDDYYGYEEIEFELYNSDGERLRWLENKIADKTIDEIKHAILQESKYNEI